MNLNKLLQLSQNIHSVKDIGELALKELEKKDPKTARTLAAIIYSGKDPSTVIKEFAYNGVISSKHLYTIKNSYGMLKKLGLKIDIPETIWTDVENALSVNTTQDIKSIKGF